ncbi:MAG: hypothetical protein ACJ8BW_20435 [Ktedonobacteraceae bacterium]
MSTMPSEHHPSQPGQKADTRVRYIEDLAGPDDAWITITDAARITRTSEAMARRWVTSGRLPVKRQAVGVNQQTRLVRLSDVAAIRPIIDPTAAFSDEMHKLDLPSIPRQQAHILREHERLTQQVQQGQHAVDEVRRDLREARMHQQQAIEDLHQQYSTHQNELHQRQTLQQQQHDALAMQVQDQTHALEQMTNDMMEQRKQLQREVERLRTTVMEQFKAAQHEREQKLSELDGDHRRQREQLREDLTTLFQQHFERIQDILKIMGNTLAQCDQDRDQLEQDLATQQQSLVLLREDLTTLLEQQGHEIKSAFEQQIAQQVQDRSALGDRLEKMEQWREQLAAQEYQQRFTAQDDQLQLLSKLLQEERAERKTFSEQLTAQQEQVQSLHREIDRLKQCQAET